ncbi:MAG: sugar ABC transporter ATP-binding protein [Chloroflexi bacterium]|nr:sugar ABC transporter ATP-binding protein [Chloroflexota bacterium]
MTSLPAAGQATPKLEADAIHKSFGSVKALQGVTIALNAGEVLGLVGDNGAGKSTLVSCLSGTLTPDAGVVRIDGREVALRSPEMARELGIETVFQDLALVNELDIVSNLFLNREITRKLGPVPLFGWMDRRKMSTEAKEILGRLRINLPDPEALVGTLSGGQRQAVAVGRAVGWGSRIVFFDEPTAALGVEQKQMVHDLICRLRDRGIAVMLISHNMQDVMALCDRVAVLRQGRKVADVPIGRCNGEVLVALITGARTMDS